MVKKPHISILVPDEDDALSAEYNVRVGERLRAIRRQKKLSLQEVEAISHEEFKASVLGAYERGERSISLPRLRRLADFYDVPIEQLLPKEVELADGRSASTSSKLAIDLVKLATIDGPGFATLSRYLLMIQVQRGDFNGKVLTVRADDVRAIAVMLDVAIDDVRVHLEEIGILFHSSPRT
jgi:transcriptional regulator with XRE-family HTH domain